MLTDEELIDVYEIALGYDKWLKSVKNYMLEIMLKGKKLLGLKLVEGKSIRSFTNEDDVIKALKKAGIKKGEYINEKLCTLTELEKRFGKEKFNDILGEYIIKPQCAPTIAKMEDKREEYNSCELDFEHILK